MITAGRCAFSQLRPLDKSKRLADIAAVGTTGEPFDNVMVMIDTMNAFLRKEVGQDGHALVSVAILDIFKIMVDEMQANLKDDTAIEEVEGFDKVRSHKWKK